MSQSWDNVANMHAELLTACSVQSRLPVSAVCMRRYPNFEPMLLWYRPHPPHCRPRAAAQTHHVIVTFLLCSNVESTIRLWQRTDLASRFAWGSVACWAGLSKRTALRTVCLRMHLYGHSRLCTQHYKSDQSWAFWTCRTAHLLYPPG